MIVVVVGASAGLGAALTIQHRLAGDSVWALARRPHRLRELADTTASAAGPLKTITADVATDDGWQAVCSTVNTAAMSAPSTAVRVYACAAAARPADSDRRSHRDYLRLGFGWQPTAISHCAEAIGPRLTWVAISSIAAALPFAHLADYCSVKAALEAWVRATRPRLDAQLVLVRPGRFASELFEPVEHLAPHRLPWSTARRVRAAVDCGRREVTLGGYRDVLAYRMSSLLGPERSRRWLLEY